MPYLLPGVQVEMAGLSGKGGRASLVTQLIKNPPIMQRPGFDPWVGEIPWRSTHFSILA